MPSLTPIAQLAGNESFSQMSGVRSNSYAEGTACLPFRGTITARTTVATSR